MEAGTVGRRGRRARGRGGGRSGGGQDRTGQWSSQRDGQSTEYSPQEGQTGTRSRTVAPVLFQTLEIPQQRLSSSAPPALTDPLPSPPLPSPPLHRPVQNPSLHRSVRSLAHPFPHLPHPQTSHPLNAEAASSSSPSSSLCHAGAGVGVKSAPTQLPSITTQTLSAHCPVIDSCAVLCCVFRCECQARDGSQGSVGQHRGR